MQIKDIEVSVAVITRDDLDNIACCLNFVVVVMLEEERKQSGCLPAGRASILSGCKKTLSKLASSKLV
jgi:hypothetical protein